MELGKLAERILHELSEEYGVQILAYVIMPNHIHVILMLESSKITVGRFVGAFKSLVSNRWQKVCDERGVQMGKLWQRNYYDHILRNDADCLEKMKYIDENPDKWAMDELYIR